VREYGRKGRGRTGEEEGKREGGGMIRNDRPSPHQKILDPPLPKNQKKVQKRFTSTASNLFSLAQKYSYRPIYCM
jgi:hypothetical protein